MGFAHSARRAPTTFIVHLGHLMNLVVLILLTDLVVCSLATRRQRVTDVLPERMAF